MVWLGRRTSVSAPGDVGWGVGLHQAGQGHGPTQEPHHSRLLGSHLGRICREINKISKKKLNLEDYKKVS
jgi:hypothetical protein